MSHNETPHVAPVNEFLEKVISCFGHENCIFLSSRELVEIYSNLGMSLPKYPSYDAKKLLDNSGRSDLHAFIAGQALKVTRGEWSPERKKISQPVSDLEMLDLFTKAQMKLAEQGGLAIAMFFALAS